MSDPPKASRRAPRKMGRYRLKRQLGRGAMGVVVEADDMSLQRSVALKLIWAGQDDDSHREIRRRVKAEARAAATLSHPGVVQVYDVGRHDDWLFVSMELMTGGDLAYLVEKKGPLPVGDACRWVAQAAKGVGAAHEAGIIHRDIKPANLMFDGHGHCKAADFGLASAHGSPESKSDTLALAPAGTPNYLCPDGARGGVGPMNDTWGLAAVLWYALTGEPPFHLEKARDVLRIHKDIHLPSMHHLREDVPERLVRFLEGELGPDPQKRSPDGTAFAERLEHVAVPVAKVVHPRGRHRHNHNTIVGITAAAVIVFLLLAVGGGFWWYSSQQGNQASASSPSEGTPATAPAASEEIPVASDSDAATQTKTANASPPPGIPQPSLKPVPVTFTPIDDSKWGNAETTDTLDDSANRGSVMASLITKDAHKMQAGGEKLPDWQNVQGRNWRVRASAFQGNNEPENAADDDRTSAWVSGPTGKKAPWFELDLGVARQVNSIEIEWARPAQTYVIAGKANANDEYKALATFDAERNRAQPDRIDLNARRIQYLRIEIVQAFDDRGIAIFEIAVRP